MTRLPEQRGGRVGPPRSPGRHAHTSVPERREIGLIAVLAVALAIAAAVITIGVTRPWSWL